MARVRVRVTLAALAAASVLSLLLLVAPASAAPRVEATGLMAGMAVLEVDGRRRVLRVGESSPEGVELLAADPQGARVRFGDRVLSLGLSRSVGGRFAPAGPPRIRVSRDTSGHFRVAGAVEGRPALFLVDTGATILAMSGEHARRLGIDYHDAGRKGQVTTAGGVSRSHFVTLDSVQVGGIRVENVQAAVVEGIYPQEILLGMSFLRHVGFSEENDVLTLQRKY